ncbi:MAG TPA: hypothetical protein VLC71_04550 [Thermomonas sp.]|nr:hypothetical protein [Thermomonas sp.]
MSEAAPPRRVGKRLLRLGAILTAILLVALLVVGWLLQPQRAGKFLLQRLGSSLGLEISARAIDYRVRGTPQLVLRDVVASRPGDAAALLHVERMFVSLPWRTIRARGNDLTVQRVELDAPAIDLPAVQRWLATRPTTGETRIPTLVDGLRVTRGRIDNEDWRIEGLSIDVPTLHPERLLRARVRGRYLAPPMSIPADLAIAIAHPRRALAGQRTGIAGVGTVTVANADWQVASHVFLAGPLRLGKDSALLKPVRLGIAARYRSASTTLPFRLGLHGPMAFNNATWRFVPVSVSLDGDDAVPDALARGSVSIGQRLVLHLDGRIAGWPDAWPALPVPLSASTSPMDVALDYKGAIDFADLAALELRRDDTRFDARFRLPAVLAWLDAEAAGSPLPPLRGNLSTPRLEIADATLEGVEVELDDPGIPPRAD